MIDPKGKIYIKCRRKSHMPRILEDHLYLPALYLIEQENGVITTSELSAKLRLILKPRGEDLEILTGRKDDKFSQIVRNLTAKERSFVKNGYISRESGRNKPLSIAPKGKQYLDNNKGMIDYLLLNNFKFEDLVDSLDRVSKENENNNKIEIFNESIDTIHEGNRVITESAVYQRSNKLREKAIQHYTVKNRIKCQACCFDFEDFYGDYGRRFIEIHHLKPIFQFSKDDLEKTINKALENVIPVCSNCHRMIHRRKEKPLTIDELKIYIRNVSRYGIAPA